MLWDGNRQAQEYTDTHVFTTIYEQNSFAPVARLVWLQEGLTIAANDESETDEGWYGNNKPEPPSAIQVYHYHNDQLGTPNELTNQEGEVVWLADYEAWGNTARIVWREEKLEQLQVSSDELQPIRFQGQSFDTETGLHYNRFRYFDPDLGMFISRDPIGLMGGSNVFAYAPNPTGWIDPFGLKTVSSKVVSFSQDSVSPIFDDGSNINCLIHAMKNNSNYFEKVNPIRVIKFKDLPDKIQKRLVSQGANQNSIFSLDNRRLLAAREAGSKINIKYVKPENVPEINLNNRFSTKNGGKKPRIRC